MASSANLVSQNSNIGETVLTRNNEHDEDLGSSVEVSSTNVVTEKKSILKLKRVSFRVDSNCTDDKETEKDINCAEFNVGENIQTKIKKRVSYDSIENDTGKISEHNCILTSTILTVNELEEHLVNIAKQTDNDSKINVDLNSDTHNISTKAEESCKIIEDTSTTNNILSNEVNSTEVTIAKNLGAVDSELCGNSVQNTNNPTNEIAETLLKTKSNIEKLQGNLSTKLSNDTIEKLRRKYSPASFGYPKRNGLLIKNVKSSARQKTRIPVPTPRSLTTDLVEGHDSKPINKIKSVKVKLISVPVSTDQTLEKDSDAEIKKEDIKIVANKSLSALDNTQVKTTSSEISKDIQSNNKNVTENENAVVGIELDVTYGNIEFAEPEEKHFIVRRSSSEDSINKVESFLSQIIMDKKIKDKKRSNSFKKILAGGFFGRDRKKSDEERTKCKQKDNVVVADNAQNESQAFDRNASYRHTVDNSTAPRISPRDNHQYNATKPAYHYSSQSQYQKAFNGTPPNYYTEMTGNNGDKFGSNKNHRYAPTDYVPMDNGNTNHRRVNGKSNYLNVTKYIDTSSSSSNTLESDNRSETYQNTLIAEAELRQARADVNAYSNLQEHLTPTNLSKQTSSGIQRINYNDNNRLQFSKSHNDNYLQNKQTSLQLVKPKALIPINSERPLPNPYHNNQERDNSSENYITCPASNKGASSSVYQDSKQYFENENYGKKTKNNILVEDVYGTVFDNIDNQQVLSKNSTLGYNQNSRQGCVSPSCKSPSSPRALETSKLKLPQNREKVELQPRIRSPIPQTKVSTDKIIATELLRNKLSLSRTSSPLPREELSVRRSNNEDVYENSSMPINSNNRNRSNVNSLSPTQSNEYVYLKSSTPSLKNKPPLPSPRESSSADYLLAAEWQRKQREFDKSPPFCYPQQITTNVMVHENPEEKRVIVANASPTSSVTRRKTLPIQKVCVTPVNQQSERASSVNLNMSPEKQHIIQNVEAFYWRELKKLKEKEEQDLMNYRQRQLCIYGYLEDTVLTRRSRSVSPSIQRGRRSLSLPRDVRSMPPIGRQQIASPEPILEGRPMIAKKPIALPKETTYGQLRHPLQRTPNFIRNNFERSTIGPINSSKNGKLIYENFDSRLNDHVDNGRIYIPIFKRGSLTYSPVSLSETPQMSKKVSFSTSRSNNLPNWPTKNGFTQSPPSRRIQREISVDDDVFLPNSPSKSGSMINNNSEMEFRSQINRDHVIKDTMNESFYANQPFQGNRNRHFYSQRGNMTPVPKQVTVSNKVCDVYGQIHDSGHEYGSLENRSPKKQILTQDYSQINHVGTLYGQLNLNSNNSVGVPYDNSPSVSNRNFVRGTRLTASVNDMYKRYPQNVRYQLETKFQREPVYANERVSEAPNRPLPPVPERRDSRTTSVRKIMRGYVPISDTESGSEAGEVQRILQSGPKEKYFNVIGGSRGENEGEIKTGRSRSARREDPRRHTLSGDQHYSMAGQGGPLSRTMDLEGQFPRGYPPSSNAMLFDDDPGIMSEVETSSTGFRRGGKQRSSLPVVRTPSKTLERPLGLVFLQYRNETKRALLPNEITSIDTVKALFVRSFPKQLSMEYLDSPLVKIYIHDSSKDMFYELEDVRSHLREIRDRSVLRLFESTDVSGGLPMGGVGIPGGIGHFEDPSYFSEPEFDSEYQHQHIHKSKGSANKAAPYYMGSTTSLPRSGPILRPYSPAVGTLPPDRLKTLPAGSAPPKPQRAYSSGATRSSDGSSRAPDRFAPFQRPANPLFNLPDGYMSSPERGSRGYEDPYYSQYTSRSGSITPVIDEEVSDTELLDEQYSLYGVKLTPGTTRGVRSQFPGPAAPPYDTTRLRVEHMERQLANLTGLVQKALTQTPTPRDFLAPPGRDAYRSDKSVSFEKSVSFSDEPPDMNSPKQHSPQHTEKDRLKPAPPPKPASLSPGQYDGRHIYRDLQLTPEMYNQLRGLQKKAKDLRAEVRNLRRMSQAQAHSVRETIRDTFIKIRAMLMAGGEQVWQAGMDQERIRLSRDEDLYKQEMLRLEKDLTDLEASVEELRGNVINRKTRVNMSDVENMALVLSKSSKTVADLKLRFPNLQDSMKAFLSAEMDKVVREEKFLKEEPERLESALRRCKKLTGTLVTLKRLASVQEQRLPCSTSANDGRISPSITETPPVTPTSGQHSKPPSGACVGQISFGGECTNAADSNQRPENALDALLDELQTFSKPHATTVNTQMPQASYSDSTPSDPPAIPVKGIPPSHSAHFSHPQMSDIGRKGSMDSATILPTQNLTVSTATGSLRRLHSYPSGSDTDNSPPIQPLRAPLDAKSYNKPPIPERNAELLQHLTSGRRVPPPPPPRTSSKSPLASPTSPSLPPRSPATGLQHIQNVQNMTDKPQSQFEAATQNLGLSTLRRNVPTKSNTKDNKAQTLPRNIGSNLQVHNQAPTGTELQNVSSSSCESVNSQDGTKKGSRKEELEQRHQELLKKQKALQEQYARLQQLQRGNNTLAVVPPTPDQLLKKTGSESNLLQKMGLQMSTTQMTGSLTNLPSSNTSSGNNVTTNTATDASSASQPSNTTTTDTSITDNSSSSSTTTSKVYETDIL